MDGWMDGRTDGRTDGLTDGCMARLSYEQFDYAEHLGLSTFGLVKVS